MAVISLDLTTTSGRLGWTLVAIAATVLVRFARKWHYQRSLCKGLPGPPHSYLWGSLQAMGEAMKALPTRAHPQGFPQLVKEKFGLGDVFVLDAWPFAYAFLVIMGPEPMREITVQHSLPKHQAVRDFLEGLGGEGNLVGSEGAVWKKWRSAFNPGFSQQHIMSLVPAIVDECKVFCEITQENARTNALFRMERIVTKLTVDIIGRVVLDESFNHQRKSNPIVESMIEIIKWMAPGDARPNPLRWIDIRKPIIVRYHTWRLNQLLGRILEDRFATRNDRGKTKAVIDLALNTYLKEVKGSNVEDATSLDPDFKAAAISNLKTFIFAGHDTTSSSIVYCYYYLSKFPEVLKKIRAEHDTIFGLDPETAAEQIKQDPRMLNKLPYTMAVIREVLRYQPPAATVREGEEGVFVHDPKTGQAFPTKGFMVWPVNVGLHRNEAFWPDPHEFKPERHLSTKSGDQSANYTSNDAWIAFSKGPRNCIGQELAIIEAKIVLALTCRSFDFVPAFDELGKLKGDGSGYPGDTHGVQTLLGDEAYQVMLGTAKPREGIPCRLNLRT